MSDLARAALTPLAPGDWLGILGAGQLGAMLCEAAHAQGLRVHTYAPADADSPAARQADAHTTAAYDDAEALARFAQSLGVATLEFENIPITAIRALARHTPVFPDATALHVAQHRLREKTFLAQHGFPLAPFCAVATPDALPPAFDALGGGPCLLKTAAFGYDGKGQRLIRDAHEARQTVAALCNEASLAPDGWVLESRIAFLTECSLISVRTRTGAMAHLGLIENRHHQGILDVSLSPARTLSDLESQAVRLNEALLNTLDYTGVLCVEYFVTEDRRLLVNEIAPRVHNSGHLTREGFTVSQFDWQVQAVAGLPLGLAARRAPAAAMANLLGDCWFTTPEAPSREPDWQVLSALPDTTLTLYGKAQPRPGRKMGHLVVTGADPHACAERALAARQALTASLARHA